MSQAEAGELGGWGGVQRGGEGTEYIGTRGLERTKALHLAGNLFFHPIRFGQEDVFKMLPLARKNYNKFLACAFVYLEGEALLRGISNKFMN